MGDGTKWARSLDAVASISAAVTGIIPEMYAAVLGVTQTGEFAGWLLRGTCGRGRVAYPPEPPP